MSTTNILDSIAVARRTEECPTIFGAYSETPGLQLAQSYTAAPTPAPGAPASAPQLGGPGGGGGTQKAPGATAAPAAVAETVVNEHEVFKNNADALAFFFYRQPALDEAPEEGPFWFSFKDDTLIAGTKETYAVFPGIEPKIIETAKKRGVIMLVEFENQQPYRCTPCYLSRSV